MTFDIFTKNGFFTFLVFLVLVPGRNAVVAQTPLQLSERQNQELVKRISLKVERFNASLGKALAKPPLVRSQAAVEFTEYLEDFTLLISELDPDTNAGQDVSEVLRTASSIERLLLCEDVPPRVVIDWASLHADLDLLARVYGIKWSVAVVTKELVARFEADAQKFSHSLNLELPSTHIIRTAVTGDLPILMQKFRQSVQTLNSGYSDSAGAQPQIDDLSSCTRVLGLYLKDRPLGLQLQADWRRLSAQVEELVRIYNLDGGDIKSPGKELITKRK